MEWTRGEYRVSTDRSQLSLPAIQRFLADSYWASDRPLGTIIKSIQNSVCYGLYDSAGQIGFARVITDNATFFWLCDVYIDPTQRGAGLGKFLISCVLSTPELQGLRGMLATSDAHDLYSRYGFQVPTDPRRFMYRPVDASLPEIDLEGGPRS